MRKYLFVILAVMLLLGVAVSPSQATIMNSPDARVRTAVWVGIASNGPTPTSGTALSTLNRIVGFRVTGTSNPAAGLYDITAVAATANSNLIDEAAAASNSESVTWYPAPKTITTGLCVVNNASTTVTTVYYE